MTSPNCARFIWKRKRRLTVIITQTVHFKAAVTILTQSPPSALPHHTNMGQKSPVKAANRRILLSTSTSVWSWLDKVGMDSRKCIFSLMAWAGGLETWVTEQSIIGITVGIYSYLSLLDLDFNERLTSWSPLNIPLLLKFLVFLMILLWLCKHNKKCKAVDLGRTGCVDVFKCTCYFCSHMWNRAKCKSAE